MTGAIVSLQFGHYLVYVDQQLVLCHLPKTDKFALKPVVGDRVDVDLTEKIIQFIHPRTSFIKRPRLANLTDLVIVNSLIEPVYSFFLHAKFISFARYYNLHVTNIITKTDLSDAKVYQPFWDYLTQQGFPIYFFHPQQSDIQPLLSLIGPSKIVAFAGQTGAGKSTLINAINPAFSRQIGSYSEALGRGKHQTKEVVLLPFQGGLLADTPGFSSLELPMIQTELAKVFPGFESRFGQCKFFNCTHQHEPDCAILEEVNRGKISLEVYQTYLKMLQQLPEQKEY